MEITKTITLPYNYEPRDYQLPFLRAMHNGYKRAVLIWHRRSGKDKTFLNFTVEETQKRVGAYYYLFPTYEQGRKALWEGVDKNGFAFLDHFPKELRTGVDNQQMKLTTKNKSIFRVVGTDKIDWLVGTNPIGCVFSEFALQNPMAWQLLRPILLENGGWAVFAYTPRGENHGYDLYEMAKANPNEWFSQILTVDDTKIITPEDIERERREGMDEDLIAQEYFCSFNASLTGAYYAKNIREAEQSGRIASVPYEDNLLVHTFWDLGIGDANAIWFVQLFGREVRLIDYYENQGEGLPHYIKVLKEKSYVYGEHYAPHDIAAREWTTGEVRLNKARDLGIDFQIIPRGSREDGIEAVRGIFNRCSFDKEKCHQGLNALKSYVKKYNETMKCYSDTPDHNWASHGADAFRGLAVSVEKISETKQTIRSPLQPNLEEIRRRKLPKETRFK